MHLPSAVIFSSRHTPYWHHGPSHSSSNSVHQITFRPPLRRILNAEGRLSHRKLLQRGVQSDNSDVMAVTPRNRTDNSVVSIHQCYINTLVIGNHTKVMATALISHQTAKTWCETHNPRSICGPDLSNRPPQDRYRRCKNGGHDDIPPTMVIQTLSDGNCRGRRRGHHASVFRRASALSKSALVLTMVSIP